MTLDTPLPTAKPEAYFMLLHLRLHPESIETPSRSLALFTHEKAITILHNFHPKGLNTLVLDRPVFNETCTDSFPRDAYRHYQKETKVSLQLEHASLAFIVFDAKDPKQFTTLLDQAESSIINHLKDLNLFIAMEVLPEDLPTDSISDFPMQSIPYQELHYRLYRWADSRLDAHFIAQAISETDQAPPPAHFHIKKSSSDLPHEPAIKPKKFL